ncbi:MAG: hypothetical protein ACK4MF_09140 [Hyphomicrobiaceae bacterium]
MTSDPHDGNTIANSQRALFTFVSFTLLAPFFAGLGVLAAFGLAPLLKLQPLLPSDRAGAGEAAVTAFVWAALPAGLAGAALAVLVWRRATFDWVAAAAAGGLAFMLSAILVPPPQSLSLTFLTLVAVGISLLVRSALLAGGIIRR